MSKPSIQTASSKKASVVPSKRDIAIKQKHIDLGYQGSGQFCPIARGCIEAVPEARRCFVWRKGSLDTDDLVGYVDFYFKGNLCKTFELPHEVTLAMVEYDMHKKMVPFGFIIPLVIDFPVDPPKTENPEPPEYKGSK